MRCLNDADFQDMDKDDNEMDEVIKDKLLAALRYILLNSDSSLLEGTELADKTGFSIDSNLVGHLSEPTDMIRIVSARLSSWIKSCNVLITEESTEYAMQSDKYACGTYERPVTALARVGGKKEVQFFKAKTSTDTLNTFTYIQEPAFRENTEGQDSLNIPDRLLNAFLYFTAALTLQAFSNELYQSTMGIAKSMMGYDTTEK